MREISSIKKVLQDGSSDCGVSSLLCIIRYYGGDISKEYLREKTDTTNKGVNAYNLIETAKELGFDSYGVEGNIEEIDVNNLPCIAHVNINRNQQHFVVIYKINQEFIHIMDPSYGKKKKSIKEFKLESTNKYIILKPIKKIPIFVKKDTIKKKIYSLIKHHKKKLIILLVLNLLYLLYFIMSSFSLKYLLVININNNISITIVQLMKILLLISFLKLFTLFTRNLLVAKLLSILDFSLTTDLYEQILLLPYIYYKNRTTGEILSRLKDLNTIKNYLVQIMISISDIVVMLIFFCFMLTLSKKLTLGIITTTILMIIGEILSQKKTKKKYRKVLYQEDLVHNHIVESLNSVDTVKGGHIEKSLIDRFRIKYQKLLEEEYRYAYQEEKNEFRNHIFLETNLVYTYIVGAILVIKSSFPISSFLLFQTFRSYYMDSVKSLFLLLKHYSNFKISYERIKELFLVEKENFKNSYYYLTNPLVGNIEMNKLSYKIGTRILLNQITIKTKENDKILLSGDSGSGKSTLVKMLLRYIEVPYGNIIINGIDINHYHLENLRQKITYVSNQELLFSDTLYQNITLHKEITEEKLWDVLKISGVDKMIENDKKKLNNLVEENGMNYSNGEKQRIVLARTLLKDSNIYIFDEAFTGLQSNLEKEILEKMFQYLKDKLIIIVSHRKYNQKLFTRIWKLEGGTISEKKKL